MHVQSMNKVITWMKCTHQKVASRRRNPDPEVDLNPRDYWAVGPCYVLVGYEHMDFPHFLLSWLIK